MAITLGNPTDQQFSEGQVSDILKATTSVDADEIKQQWEDIKDNSSSTGERILQTTDMLNKETIGKTNSKIASINDKMDKKTIRGGSIIARSRNSVLQFPVYCTQSIRINEAQIIAKLFERVYTSFVQSALAQNPVVNEDEVNNLLFLKQFHTNLKESPDLVLYNEYYEPVDDIDAIMKEAAYYSEWITPTLNVEFRFIKDKNMDLFRENSRLMNEPLSGLHYLKEADRVKADDMIQKNTEERTDKRTNVDTSEVKLSAKDIEEIAVREANLSKREREVYGKSTKQLTDELKASKPQLDDAAVKKEVEDLLKVKAAADKKVAQATEDFKADAKKPSSDPSKKAKNYKYDGHNFIMASSKAGNSTTKTTITKSTTTKPPVDAPKLLRDADIKKINGMLPYTIETTFRVRNKENNVAYDVHFIIGVKTVMHLIRVQDLQDDLQELVSGTVKGLQKVRYKTGEIKFMDYVFNFKGLKADAAKRVNYNKRWLNSLKRMADYEKLHGTMFNGIHDDIFGGQVPIPNGTIILSQSDVTTLTANTGIDLGVVANAKRLAKSLFLIAVAIVDPSAGSMKVLFPDNDTDWDVQSLASIDAELAKTDNSQIMRELNRMVNR